jgi:hypothetical protein
MINLPDMPARIKRLWKDERGAPVSHASALAAQAAEIARLRKWLEDRPIKPHPVDQLNNLNKALLEDAEAENTRLREALTPFAAAADCCSEDWPDTMIAKDISIGALRAARAALNGLPAALPP